jgi:hypothetical protein
MPVRTTTLDRATVAENAAQLRITDVDRVIVAGTPGQLRVTTLDALVVASVAAQLRLSDIFELVIADAVDVVVIPPAPEIIPPDTNVGGSDDGLPPEDGIPAVFTDEQMCRITLQDPSSNFWRLNATGDGMLEIVSIDNTRIPRFKNPIMKGSDGLPWRLSVNSDGVLQVDRLDTAIPEDSQRMIEYIPFEAEGIFYKLRVRSNGILRLYETETLFPEFFPHPNNVTYSDSGASHFIHDACMLSSITTLGNVGYWCCACNRFVTPDEANILEVID